MSAVLFGISALASGGNPFISGNYYVNPAYQAELDKSISTATGTALTNMKQMRDIPSAYWIDKKAKLRGTTTDTLEGIMADASKKPTPPLTVFILYNLPNRDCDSTNSRGEICCYTHHNGTCDLDNNGTCAEGLTDYKNNYVDVFAAILAEYPTVPVVVIIEPDSLPNLATNLKNPHCANTATNAAYTEGIKYAVSTLKAKAPRADLYVDAAHGGWLGWSDNAQAFATLLSALGIVENLRGLSSNVANYQTIGTPCPNSAFDDKMHNYCAAGGGGYGSECCKDDCNLLAQYSAGNNEYNYIQSMMKELNRAIPYWTPHWVIDSGRAGQSGERSSCSNWCNIRGAGVGLIPTSNTSLPTVVDAVFWLKTPGESDGCTEVLPDGTSCGRFDKMCASVDSIGTQATEPRAPYAGGWFDYQIKKLAENANFHVQTATTAHTAQKMVAFGHCSTDNAGCPEGYSCMASVCMPTAATIQAFKHDSKFATRYEHATKMLTVEQA